MTDAGLRHLSVWQSKVTDEGVKGLKAALPNLEVSTGWDIAQLMKKADEEKKKAEEEEEKKKKEAGAGKNEREEVQAPLGG